MCEKDIFGSLMEFSAVDFSKKKVEKSETKLKPSEKIIKEIRENGFDMSQLETVLRTKGNQLILSCAGSGKTTSLVFKVIYDQKTAFATRIVEVNGNKIPRSEPTWVCTFLHSGAEELKSSMIKWQRRLKCRDTSDSVQFSTLHAEFKRALNQMAISTDIIDSMENRRLLKGIVEKYCLTGKDGRPLNADNLRDLEGALTYTRNRLDNSRYDNEVYDDLGITKTIIDHVLRDWKTARLEQKKCDFEDLQEKLYEECYVKGNQSVINFIANRYKLIYIDEFQDTSQIQYALLKIYGGNAKQVVAIGDDDQTIYSWRGSYNGIITKEFIEDFNPVKTELSTNFRCPSNILNAIKGSIEQNTTRFKKNLKSYREGGLVRVGAFPGYKAMVESLEELVAEDIKNKRSVAILCRVNSDGLVPAIILDKMGTVGFSISGDGMTFDSYIGRSVLGIVKLFTERATQSVKNALTALSWKDQYCVTNLLRVCKSSQKSIWTIDATDLAYSCPSIASEILTWRRWKEEYGDVKALRLILKEYRLNVYNSDSQFNEVARSVIMSVETLLDFYNYDSVEDFLIELNDINERLKARKKKANAQIKVATVHEFKGKEADSVYVWNDSENVFPYRDSIEDMERYEEERRIHYIACTRASKINTIMYLKSKPGDFVLEMDLSNAENIVNSLKSGESMLKLGSGSNYQEAVNRNKFKEKFVDELDDGTEDNPFWGGDDGE
jgi:DNA helicase-2/ATP-dependent DNA helicase PcrA